MLRVREKQWNRKTENAQLKKKGTDIQKEERSTSSEEEKGRAERGGTGKDTEALTNRYM